MARRCIGFRSPRREAISRIGSGDAFLAGYVATRYSERARRCLRYGVACGAESTQHFGAGAVDPAHVGRLLGEVRPSGSRLARKSVSAVCGILRGARGPAAPTPWNIRALFYD